MASERIYRTSHPLRLRNRPTVKANIFRKSIFAATVRRVSACVLPRQTP